MRSSGKTWTPSARSSSGGGSNTIEIYPASRLGEDPEHREVYFTLIPCPNCGKEIAIYVTQGPHFEVMTGVGRTIRVWRMVINGDKVSISPSIDLSQLKDHKCHVIITDTPFKWKT